MNVTPITLEGKLVRLEPLKMKHVPALYAVGQDPTIWRYMPFDGISTLTDMEDWVSSALEMQRDGRIMPFAIIERSTQRAIGSTRYMHIVPHDRGLEIGSTWLTATVRRTGVNTECKYLLLRHAFEEFGAIRVQLKTDSRNLVSQRAIERLGAVKEGILRNHIIMPDNYYRHTVYYSIIDTEWPAVKAGLEEKMRIPSS